MKSLLYFIFISFLLGPTYQVWANAPPEGMALIKKGCFMMGTNKIYDYLSFDPNTRERPNDRERPVHEVCLDAFYLDIHETSQKKWEEMKLPNNSVYKGLNIAVNQVEWEDANGYCKKLGNRLPTEAEWEYAARAGTTTEYPWGDKINRNYVWYGGNSGHTHHPIGTRKPNSWGLYDMMGGVWEWVSDWYGEFYYKMSPMKNPKGPANILSWHVIRGGSWVDDKEFVRTTIRYPGLADNTEDFWVGFRCASDIN
jgi:formylglycine-generating enzyme required for sulfatase activity